MPLRLPAEQPEGGVALIREWIADLTEVQCSDAGLDGLLLAADEPGVLAGFLACALRLNLPAVCAPGDAAPFSIALAALGVAPLVGDAAEVAVKAGCDGAPQPRDLVQSFSLANALRAGLSAGGGPELLVHLSALAREAGEVGFSQTLRVLAPETPEITGPDSDWFAGHGAAGLLAYMGVKIHRVPTVAGHLSNILLQAPEAPPERPGSKTAMVRGRASGTEALCRVLADVHEIAGECRVFTSEEEAVWAVREGGIQESTLLVVNGCGPRGGPGLLRLDGLGRALAESGLAEVAVITDGLPPESAAGSWVSLVAPETVDDGVLGYLRDGDTLRIDLESGAIRTGVKAHEMDSRESLAEDLPTGTGYAARYARSALSAIEGAGFG